MGQDAGVFWKEFALTPRSKKAPEESSSFFRRNSGIHFGAVMDRWLLEQPWPMRDRAAFGIVRSVIEPCDPCMGDSAGTHGAGFKRYPQVAPCQSVVAQGGRCLTHRDDFGMGGGVVARDRAIGAATDNYTILDYNCAYRHFASRCRRSCQFQRFFHHVTGFGQRHPASLAFLGAFGYTAT